MMMIIIDVKSLYFDTGEELYIGGIPAHAHSSLPKQVRSRDGYRGCLATLELDLDIVNPLARPLLASLPDVYRGHIEVGCSEDEGKTSWIKRHNC